MTSTSSVLLDSVAVYSYVIVAFAAVGVVFNAVSLVILVRKRFRSMFHNLLKILAISDFVVVIGVALLYAIPDLWYFYNLQVHPVVLPYLLPLVQIAVMISVYCTIVMSFERYVRIGYTCRLRRCSYITVDNFRYYVVGIIICPILFYVPKFFELRTVYKSIEVDMMLNCGFERSFNDSSVSSRGMYGELQTKVLSVILQECLLAKMSQNKNINITKSVDTVNIESTPLAQDPLYYKIYCIGLNTIFASMFPLVSLLYLNIYTVIALRKLGVENSAAARSRAANSPAARSSDLAPAVTRVARSVTRVARNPVTANVDTALAAVHNIEAKRVFDSACKSTVTLSLENHRSHEARPCNRRTYSQLYFMRANITSGKDSRSPNVQPNHREHQPQMPQFRKLNRQKRRSNLHMDRVIRRSENRITRIALAIVWLFLFCHCWKLVPTFYEAVHGDKEGWPNWLTNVNDISHSLIVFNSAVNFLLYRIL